MKHLERIQSEEAFKIVGETFRLTILRLLMARSMTISQLGVILSKHPAQIRHHVKQLEKVGLVELESIKTVKNYLEKYYRSNADAFIFDMAVFPETSASQQVVIFGDLERALDLLEKNASELPDAPAITVMPAGSLDGMIYLRDNYCQMAMVCLIDDEKGMPDHTAARILFPDSAMKSVNLCYHQQGLLVRKGNPRTISGLEDLLREDISFVNLKKGSLSRTWLDGYFKDHEILPASLNGYTQEAVDEQEMGRTILSGSADYGIGRYALAREFRLDFIPLFEERIDLLMREEFFGSPVFQSLLAILRSVDFQESLSDLGGNRTDRTGEVIAI